MDRAKFGGYLAEPMHFNNVGILVLDDTNDRKGLVHKLAEWGCMTVSLDMYGISGDFISAKPYIISALNFLYRYSQKLIIIGVYKGAYFALKTAEIYEDIDGVLCFDPIIFGVHFEQTTNSHAILRFFLDPENEQSKAHVASYESFLQQTKKDYKILSYNPRDLATLSQQEEMQYNPLIEEIFTIVQFI